MISVTFTKTVYHSYLYHFHLFRFSGSLCDFEMMQYVCFFKLLSNERVEHDI